MDTFNIAFSIGNAALTWNGVIMAASILVAVLISGILVKKRGAYKDLALDACIIGIPAGLIGARLFSALSGKIAFASFFDLSVSGLNLPGALLFVGVGIAVYAKLKKFSVSEVFDILTPGAFFGLALGRWSDFFLCEGLGPVVTNPALKFFPISTFTTLYFTDRQTVAYAVFFLDFLVCAALGVTALLLKNRKAGKVSRITIILYLFAEFILEWLRDGAQRQIVFGEVRFNQIVLMAMLLFFVVLSLILAKREDAPKDGPELSEKPEKKTEEPEETPDEPEDAPDNSEETEKNADAAEPDEPDEENTGEAESAADGGEGDAE